jgi:hypothetical protein
MARAPEALELDLGRQQLARRQVAKREAAKWRSLGASGLRELADALAGPPALLALVMLRFRTSSSANQGWAGRAVRRRRE